MGCFPSKPRATPGSASGKSIGNGTKTLRRPKWKSTEPITASKLQAMREEFWDTQPAYGGDQVIWDALKAATATDLQTATLILSSAGIILAHSDMSTCYDERGAKYELPNYVLSEPTNLSQDDSSKDTSGSRLVELQSRNS